MSTNSICLTIEAAKSIFGISEVSPITTLRYWQNIVVSQNSDQPYSDMKFMLLLPKTYLNYRSSDVRYAIQGLLNLIIDDIYNDKEETPLNSLKFLYPIVWYHRNIKDYRAIRKLKYEKEFIEEFRKNLLAIGAIKSYQTVMF